MYIYYLNGSEGGENMQQVDNGGIVLCAVEQVGVFEKRDKREILSILNTSMTAFNVRFLLPVTTSPHH